MTRTIVVGGLVAGYIGSWEQDGKRLVAYWMGREHWGKGIATRALSEFLVLEPIRSLHAWVRGCAACPPTGLTARAAPAGALVVQATLRRVTAAVRRVLAKMPSMIQSQKLAKAHFRDHFHACAFVMGPDEERAVIDPFLVEGMTRGEKAVYIVDPSRREEHEARLLEAGPRGCVHDDLLDVTTWNEAHLKGGSFEQNRMMSSLDEMLRSHAAAGRPPMRLVGQMGWVFSSPPGIEQLVAYEASVNEVLNRGRTPTVCVYDARRLSGGLLMDLMRAHPLTVINGVLHENPFYTPAPEMLRELERRTS